MAATYLVFYDVLGKKPCCNFYSKFFGHDEKQLARLFHVWIDCFTPLKPGPAVRLLEIWMDFNEIHENLGQFWYVVFDPLDTRFFFKFWIRVYIITKRQKDFYEIIRIHQTWRLQRRFNAQLKCFTLHTRPRGDLRSRSASCFYRCAGMTVQYGISWRITTRSVKKCNRYFHFNEDYSGQEGD